MFTGLVENLGTLRGSGGGKLRLLPRRPLENPVFGESIAVNGCCLTLERVLGDGRLEFHTLAETLNRTNLSRLPDGATVNLERALRVGDRLGGHIVQGHVDTVAPVRSVRRLGDGDYELSVALPPEFAALIVEKGSVAIDGVSLTVAGLAEDFFSVRLIPQTLRDTALVERTAGKPVNLEFDVLGRYVARRMELSACAEQHAVTMETLQNAGFF